MLKRLIRIGSLRCSDFAKCRYFQLTFLVWFYDSQRNLSYLFLFLGERGAHQPFEGLYFSIS